MWPTHSKYDSDLGEEAVVDDDIVQPAAWSGRRTSVLFVYLALFVRRRSGRMLGIMIHDGNSVWFDVLFYSTTGIIYSVPISAVLELLAALFSRQVRQYIVKHPVAHVVWFACALFLALVLIPAPSKPRDKQNRGMYTVMPNLAASGNGAVAISFHAGRPRRAVPEPRC